MEINGKSTAKFMEGISSDGLFCSRSPPGPRKMFDDARFLDCWFWIRYCVDQFVRTSRDRIGIGYLQCKIQ